MKRFLVPLTGLALAFAFVGCSDETLTGLDSAQTASPSLASARSGGSGGETKLGRTYEITLENLTPATGPGSSQVFSPPVVATHGRGVRMFREGRRATEELMQIAEDAVNQPMLDLLNGSPRVLEAFAGGDVIPPGQSATYAVTTAPGFRRLSMAFMLVNTNDGFGGADALRLPRHGEETYYLYAYDAGSERNTELAEHIPGPCCGSPGEGIPERARISEHPGILGIGDLDPADYGWEGPVAKLTVRRVNPAYEVTLENLTPATVDGGSQVFSPPILATHGRGVRMFRVGGRASDGLAAIAEDGMNGPMADRLREDDGVLQVVLGTGPVFPGTSASFEIEATGAQRRLSMAFMLVNTNDAFSGLDRLRLPAQGTVTYTLDTYDAGSEENTELAAHIPGPCCGSPGVGVPTEERIAHHPGILGIGDLDPKDYGWEDPAARVTITRIR